VLITYESILNLYLSASGFPAFFQLRGDNAPLFLFIWQEYALRLVVLWCAGAFVSGWLAVRMAHRNRMALAPLAAVAQMPLALWWGVPISMGLLERVGLHHVPLRIAVGWAAGWVGSLFATAIAIPLCGLLGAMWSASQNTRLATRE
jgi:hypothetical protein